MYIQGWLCWLAPIIGSFIMPTLRKVKYNKIRDIIALIPTAISLVCSFLMLPLLFSEKPFLHESLGWIPIANVSLGILVDPLSIIMSIIVSFIGFLILVYSVGYMHGDPDISRYWFFMNLFIGGMLMLVLADNLIQMFFGWEIVGLTSWALIGYYYTDEKKLYWVQKYPPSHCSLKAFIMTKFGDMLMLMGMLIIYIHAKTWSFLELTKNTGWISTLHSKGLLLATLLLLLGGPLGKSAQFPLHEWLPEAMSGPTPVSALIHAATMVKAGVYFMARILPLFHYAAWHMGFTEVKTFFLVVAVIGGFSAFLAGSQAITAIELKRILAYSTISQIGYMMLALGIAGLMPNYIIGLAAGIFHLISHAIFKASLFLCAGSVIHGVEEKNVLKMGGLGKYMKITYTCMTINALALAGVPPLSGFWSKDAVLAAAYNVSNKIPYLLGLFTVGLTIFYSIRMIGYVFLGEESDYIKHLKEEGHEPHEAPKVMYIPYTILTALTILVGIIAIPLEKFLHKKLEVNILTISKPKITLTLQTTNITANASHTPLILSLTLLIIGLIPSYLLYVKRITEPKSLLERSLILGGLNKFLKARWFINPIYYAIFVNGLIKFANILCKFSYKIGYLFHELTMVKGVLGLASSLRKLSYKIGYIFHEFIMVKGTLGLAREMFEADYIPDRACSKTFTVSYDKVRRIQTGLLTYNILEYIIGVVVLTLILIIFLYAYIF